MKFLRELMELGDLLEESGLDAGDAKDYVLSATKRAKKRKISVIRALQSYAKPDARETSKSYQLHIALKEIGDARLNRFRALATTPFALVV